ncbi:DUF6585 family protein [Nocardia sp. CA-151230]|uniref:DUF6585 family protein n=1 Tax=Nocardia sp. CA-151230 TaxID=3239982 RepID=UPI003D90E2A0
MSEPKAESDSQTVAAIEKAAAGADLGTWVATYPWRIPPVPWRGYLLWGGLWIVIAGAWGFAAGTAAGGWAIWFVVVLGLPLIARSRSRSGFADWHARLALYERGVVVVGERGALHTARFDATLAYLVAAQYPADAFRREKGRPRQYTGNLTDSVGQRFPLTGYFDTDFWLRGGYTEPEIWAPAIQDGIVDARFDAATEALDAGQTLDFGPVQLAKSGISADRQTIDRASIEGVSVDTGRVGVIIAGTWRPLNGAAHESVPNYRLLIALANHLRDESS